MKIIENFYPQSLRAIAFSAIVGTIGVGGILAFLCNYRTYRPQIGGSARDNATLDAPPGMRPACAATFLFYVHHSNISGGVWDTGVCRCNQCLRLMVLEWIQEVGPQRRIKFNRGHRSEFGFFFIVFARSVS